MFVDASRVTFGQPPAGFHRLGIVAYPYRRSVVR